MGDSNMDGGGERILRNNATTTAAEEKLLRFLERKHEYPALMRNEIEELTEGFVAKLEETMELYETKCLPILDDMPVPAPVRERSDELLEELENGRKVTATMFAHEIKNVVEQDLLPPWIRDDDFEDDDDDDFEDEEEGRPRRHRGLDSDRDTEKEVENILLTYSEALDHYPKLFRCTDLRNVTFIPLVARLRMELCEDLKEIERGGLMVVENEEEDCSVFELLTAHPHSDDTGEYQLLDALYVAVMRRLKEMDLFRKEDIQHFDLLHRVCTYGTPFFPERRFRFLSDWDPDELARCDHWGRTPLHNAVSSPCHDLRGFQLVFEKGVQYFQNKKGIHLLFHNDYYKNETPFDWACKRHGREKVLEAIENVLVIHPYNPAQALLSAVVDERINLDGVYFILRRDPSVLSNLLLSTPAAGGGSPHDESNGNDGADGRDNAVRPKQQRHLRKRMKTSLE